MNTQISNFLSACGGIDKSWIDVFFTVQVEWKSGDYNGFYNYYNVPLMEVRSLISSVVSFASANNISIRFQTLIVKRSF
jgi:hypothetical protein